MPELPEVEDAARRLRKAVLGRTVKSVRTFHPAIARTLTARACKQLVDRVIVDVARRAKIQLITVDDGQVLEVHFRMTGDWDFGDSNDDAPKFERVRIVFTDKTRASLTDNRAFAVMRLHAPGTWREPVLGPEPLSDDFTSRVLGDALAKRSGPIKTVLLDQRVIAGIGNIYAAEALWVARIHPTRAAVSLSTARVRALRDAIREVLNSAPVGRYYAAEAKDDATAHVWRVYGREGETCTRCGKTIRRIVQGGRSTFYCGGCQR